MSKVRNLNLWLIALVVTVSTMAIWISAGMNTIYRNYDGPYYVAIAKSWYDQGFIRENFSFPLPLEYYPAHFPLYPLVIDLVNLIGLNHLQAMVLINLFASIVGALVIYKIFEKQKWGNPFWVSLAWLFFWPRMWAVRSVGSPETLFILLILLSLNYFNLKKYWLAAIMGSLAILTKSPGILLLVTYLSFIIYHFVKTKKIEWKAWPVALMGLTLLGLFFFFQIRTGDFWAYFKTGDNIHLGIIPFRVFDSSQSWVGSWWLEDVLWIYLISLIGVIRAIRKNLIWGIYGLVFLIPLFFVSHRDIARYSLPLVPVILLGLSEIFEKKEVRWALVLIIIPIFFYTLNFVSNNTLAIADWAPLL